MERKWAIALSSVVAGVVVLAAIVFGASSALGSGGGDNVGELQPTAPGMTLVVDPASGSATVLTPTTTPVAARSGGDDKATGHDSDERDGDDHDSDDDRGKKSSDHKKSDDHDKREHDEEHDDD